jgi:hypothetical protein
MSDRSVIWMPLGWPGAEHLVLRERPDGWLAEGHVVGVDDPDATAVPYTVRYVVHCDERWHVRRVDVGVVTAEGVRTLELRADGAGHWSDGAGAPLPDLDGCPDVDIRVTPFTNTLPIRRLGLEAGASAVVRVAYVAAPAMTVAPLDQRYTRLDAGGPLAGRYRYESLDSGFTADLVVDGDGLVVDYPAIWRRAAP